jgi:hypothetical protein
MLTYVTFGQNHVHNLGGKTFDKNCVAVIEARDAAEGRKKAFEYFGPYFCFEYPEDYWDESERLKYFPRGYVHVNC